MYSKQAARKLLPLLVGGECLPASLPTRTPTPTTHHPISPLSAFVLKLQVGTMCSLQHGRQNSGLRKMSPCLFLEPVNTLLHMAKELRWQMDLWLLTS